MNARQRQLIEAAAHAAYWWSMGFLIVAIHLAFGTAALAHAGSWWGILTGILSALTARRSWKSFRKASVNFSLIEPRP
jgi:hypothetical protein